VTSFLTFYLERLIYVNVPSKSNKQKNLEQNSFFVGFLSATDKQSRIRNQIRKSMVRIRGSGSKSVPKCHGSTTLFLSLPCISCPFRSRLSHHYIFFLSFTPYSSFFGLDTAFLVIFFLLFLRVSFPPACSVVPTVLPIQYCPKC
jgi:hypothetical protein